MNLRPTRPESPDLNITPLMDVVFLLLIFFMVSTTFEKESVIKIDLPEATTEAQPPKEETVLDVIVDAEGHFFVNQQPVVSGDPDALSMAIQKVVEEKRDIPVIITADGRAPHQAVITVMDVASRLGLTRMSFPTQLPERGQ